MRAAPDGVNLALIHNASAASTGGCDPGLGCVLAELGQALVRGWDWALQQEMQLIQQVSRVSTLILIQGEDFSYFIVLSHRKKKHQILALYGLQMQ